jgi:hypothetical protein
LRHVISWRETQPRRFFHGYAGSNVLLCYLCDTFIYSVTSKKLSTSDTVFDAVRLAPPNIVQKSTYSDKRYVSVSSQFRYFHCVLRDSFHVFDQFFAAATIREKL